MKRANRAAFLAILLQSTLQQGTVFLMVKASQSTGLVITFFARPQFAFFVGIISSMVSSELFEESYDLRVKLIVLLKLT